MAYKTFKPTLKSTQKKVIYLTKEELARIREWTGHSDYKAMKPYIDIVDSIRAKEMTKMDFMDD